MPLKALELPIIGPCDTLDRSKRQHIGRGGGKHKHIVAWRLLCPDCFESVCGHAASLIVLLR